MKWLWKSNTIFWQFQYSGKFESLRWCYHGWGATKSLKASGTPIPGEKSGKEITNTSAGLTTEEL